MGLYLCIFRGGEEIDGADFGAYSDFNAFRSAVVDLLEGGRPGATFPTLVLHSDCDGTWSPDECLSLEDELLRIKRELEERPPAGYASEWQRNVAEELGLNAANLSECFIDVDGAPMVDRLLILCRRAQELRQPIVFQ